MTDPSIQSLLEESLDKSDGTTIVDESRRRVLMQALKAINEEKYEDVLGRYAPSQQQLLRSFVDGQPLNALAEKLPCDISTAVGYQQNLEIFDDTEEKMLAFFGHAKDGGYKPVKLPITTDPEAKNPA